MDFWQRFLWLFTGGEANPSTQIMFLRGALFGCSVFALIQLLTMVATRWGDKNPMQKSFFLSMLIHLCIGLGWATVVESSARRAIDGDPLLPIPVRPAAQFAEDRPADAFEGDVPVWERPTQSATKEISRTERAFEESDLAPAPKTETPRPIQPVQEMPVLPSAIQDHFAQPERKDAAADLTRSAKEITSLPEEQVLMSRKESPNVIPTRSPLPRPNDEQPSEAIPRVERGGGERMAPQPNLLAQRIEADVASDAVLPRAVGPLAENVVRREGASPSPLVDDVTPGMSSATSKGAAHSRVASKAPSATGLDEGPIPPNTPAKTGPNQAGVRSPLLSLGPTSHALPQVDGPAPSFVRPQSSTINRKPSDRLPATYEGRRLEQRSETAIRNGGSRESEQAVEAALKYLASTQTRDGFWSSKATGGGASKVDLDDNDRLGSGSMADTGITGLSVLAFLGAGYTHEEGMYAENVDRALRWLIRKQKPNGSLAGDATYFDVNYCHAIANFAMAEALAMQGDRNAFPALRRSVEKGVNYILEQQNPDGGWRYKKGQRSDMSMFGWQMMALKSAEQADLEIPAESRRMMIAFLRDRSLGERNGLAGYRKDEPPTPAMTAEALFCKQMFGIRRDNPACVEAVEYLTQNLPKMSAPNDYYWYYGTLAMFQHGGEPWDQWNRALRDTLIRTQRKSGPQAGSWEPTDPWGGIGGRVYSTAMGALSLEVYYRFLPLYRHAGPE